MLSVVGQASCSVSARSRQGGWRCCHRFGATVSEACRAAPEKAAFSVPCVHGWLRVRGHSLLPLGSGVKEGTWGMAGRGAWQHRVAGRHLPPYFSCIFSRMGTIMSNFGRLAGSSFMQIFISLQMWGDMPGGMVGRSPSRATWERRRAGQDQKPEPSPASERQSPSYLWEESEWALLQWGPCLASPPRCLLRPRSALADLEWCALPSPLLTFMPISMLDKSANGTSRVTSSHSSTAKLHMSAERLLISSGFFCKAVGNPA